ncbi:MAG: 3-oxoacyl-[acyl-carrier-protein] synthase II [Salibacteraceae bacterium]|jgi:3-oxoacyl-[acyl-carrier-protein] synthase II
MELKRVVVTGLGAITPIGNNVPEFWESLIAGKSGGALITHFNTEHFKTKFACEVKNFDVNGYFERREGRRMDKYAKFAHISSDEAIKDANLDPEKLDLDRVGVIFASGIGGITTYQEEVIGLAKSNMIPKLNPFFIPKMIADIAAGLISIKYGFRGANYATVSACASSTHAMIDAFNLIRLGKQDVIITGGAEAAITESGIGGFNAMQALSTRNDSPETASRPFDAEREGFVMGEGSGAVILEDLDHALARGARIYAEIIGGGMTADAHHITAPHPEGLGAINVMKQTMDDFNDIVPTDVDYINVHGTSTPLGDIAETKAIKAVFGEHAFKLNISSTKSMTGHLLGAAGAVESIATILAVQNDIIPPTINHFTDDENIDSRLNLTFGKAVKKQVNAALSNTFGFGGHNASVLFRKYKG